MSKNVMSFFFNSTEIEYPLKISIFLRGVQTWFAELKLSVVRLLMIEDGLRMS
jgi:hypothetical protein